MNKHILLLTILSLAFISAEAACAARLGGRCCRAASGSCRITVGGPCRKTYGPVMSTEDAPWKVVPLDIQMLSDDSLTKKRFVKCFDLVPKSIKSWTRQKYDARNKFFNSRLWEVERKKLVAALDRNTRLSREPAVTKEEVLKMAEEMVIFGRGLTVGNSSGIGIKEVADLYRFQNVSRFLKDAMEFDRYRRKGFARPYPSDIQEFRDFETLIENLNPVEWREFRAKLADMNATYASGGAGRQGR